MPYLSFSIEFLPSLSLQVIQPSQPQTGSQFWDPFYFCTTIPAPTASHRCIRQRSQQVDALSPAFPHGRAVRVTARGLPGEHGPFVLLVPPTERLVGCSSSRRCIASSSQTGPCFYCSLDEQIKSSFAYILFPHTSILMCVCASTCT